MKRRLKIIGRWSLIILKWILGLAWLYATLYFTDYEWLHQTRVPGF